jgi:hypothetical protein
MATQRPTGRWRNSRQRGFFPVTLSSARMHTWTTSLNKITGGGAESLLSAPLTYLSKTGNYRYHTDGPPIPEMGRNGAIKNEPD